jgi:hypothetical protein
LGNAPGNAWLFPRCQAVEGVDADMNEIMYRLYVLDKIRKGLEAVELGRIRSRKTLQRKMGTWWSGRTRQGRSAIQVRHRLPWRGWFNRPRVFF